MIGVSAGMRILAAALVGLFAAAVTLLLGAPKYAPAIGWDVAASSVLIWVWVTIWPMGSEATADHATREDPTRPVGDAVLLGASVVSLAAVGFFLVQAAAARGSTRDMLAGIGVLTVALSWLVVHTVFTLRYAQLFHTGHDGGIDFNQSTPPRYSDFAYLAFTVGMAFQVSDTALKTPAIRAAALRHALLSYLFGAIIIATTINLVASLGGRN
jgi:uncharacterized membrane protein